MTELPEALCLSRQMSGTVRGKTIVSVLAGTTPHKFTWYFGEPEGYGALLSGEAVDGAKALGGSVELSAGDKRVVFQDGAPPRFFAPGEKRPPRHQLLMEFDDGSALAVTVRMYGGIYAFREGENDNPYYLVSKEKRSPYDPSFDYAYFRSLTACDNFEKLSVKEFLATRQRIPGLGNGVLQDILWYAGLHPKRKMGTVDEAGQETLFRCMVDTLRQMAACGGRDTEKDLFGAPGGYHSLLSKNTVGMLCPACGSLIGKASYLGGSVYVCPKCQPLFSPSMTIL